MPLRRTLVAGIGNVFLGDDGFGVEVVRRLGKLPMPEGVTVADFGVRGVHLAYEVAGGEYHSLILVDASPRGGAPGTLYVIEPSGAPSPSAVADAHGLTPDAVLAWLERLGARPPRVVVVGCEPASLGESMELSAPVAAVVDEAVRMTRDLALETSSETASGHEVTPCA